jgi:apolipoprotein N-acyltransferase
MNGLAPVIWRLTGWRRAAAAVLAGAAAATALPPFNLLPLLIAGFVPLVWLVDTSASRRVAFAAGWWFGLGHFVVLLHWLAFPLLVDAGRFAWLVPVAVLAVPAGLALFTAAAAAAAHAVWRPGWRRVVILAAAWTVAEWLRGHVLTGFPWALIGYAWSPSTALLQVTAGVGIYGLSFVTVIAAAIPASLWPAPDAVAAPPRLSWRPSAVVAAVLVLLWTGGTARIALTEVALRTEVPLRIVQPNIPQREKWLAEKGEANLVRLIALTRRDAAPSPEVVIWPETAATFRIEDGSPAAVSIGWAIDTGVILTGAPRTNGETGAAFRAWNSLYAIEPAGEATLAYDKHHLVPFGEYLPLRGLLSRIGVDKITQGSFDYSRGGGTRTIRIDGVPSFSPLICYEAIFAGAVVDRSDRPDWLLSITNDAWFGPWAGPVQHFSMARVRAVEQGLPLVRAANTGISGVVDPVGRVTASLDTGRTGALDGALPAPISAPPYARFGDILAAALILACLLFVFGLKEPQQ